MNLLSSWCRLGQALVYNKIRQAVGIKDIVVSGGGSLATHLDDFFEVLGLQVINGWGLSEAPPSPSSSPASPAMCSAVKRWKLLRARMYNFQTRLTRRHEPGSAAGQASTWLKASSRESYHLAFMIQLQRKGMAENSDKSTSNQILATVVAEERQPLNSRHQN